MSSSELQLLEFDPQTIWFQQDGATARLLMDVARDMFPEHIIFQCGNIFWPTRSLLPLLICYCLFNKSRITDELKFAIR